MVSNNGSIYSMLLKTRYEDIKVKYQGTAYCYFKT